MIQCFCGFYVVNLQYIDDSQPHILVILDIHETLHLLNIFKIINYLRVYYLQIKYMLSK